MGTRLLHVNLFAWKEGTTEADIEALGGELVRIRDEIPELTDLVFGPDLGLMDGNVDFAVIEEFDDIDAFHRYLAHPAHGRMVKEFVAPMLASRTAVQLEAPSVGA
jgi:hypothetical protein